MFTVPCKYRVLNLPIFQAKLSRCYILILKNRVENDSKANLPTIPTWNIITILTMLTFLEVDNCDVLRLTILEDSMSSPIGRVPLLSL